MNMKPVDQIKYSLKLIDRRCIFTYLMQFLIISPCRKCSEIGRNLLLTANVSTQVCCSGV